MSNTETLKKITRAKKLLKDALILLEDLDLEKPNETPGNGIDCPPRPEEGPAHKNRRDFL